MSGGYDDGYRRCSCFWGRNPGSFVQKLCKYVPDFAELNVLDVGCGEGKNAHFLATRGARVEAVDISQFAIRNARKAWPAEPHIEWHVRDIRRIRLPHAKYDIVLAYGLLHCLTSPPEVWEALQKLKHSTRIGGVHVLCSFNDRRQDLKGHPTFKPTLVSHHQYADAYSEWAILEISDTDLYESHPHNGIEHSHSLTRLIAKRVT